VPRTKIKVQMKEARPKYDLQKDIKERNKNALPVGMVKALNHRLPANATEEQAEVANWAFAQIAKVASGQISFRQAPTVLKAATQIRDEINGPIPKDITIHGKLSLEQLLARAEDPQLGTGE
jgi:hypothetical protein